MSTALWDFAVAHYGQAGVEQACLQMQDEYALDVNVLLLCCWLGQQRRGFSAETMQAVLHLSQAWQDNAIGPLRHARRWLKNQRVDRLRATLKQVELDTERHYLSLLEQQCLPLTQLPAGDTRENFASYLQALNISVDAALAAQLRLLHPDD